MPWVDSDIQVKCICNPKHFLKGNLSVMVTHSQTAVKFICLVVFKTTASNDCKQELQKNGIRCLSKRSFYQIWQEHFSNVKFQKFSTGNECTTIRDALTSKLTKEEKIRLQHQRRNTRKFKKQRAERNLINISASSMTIWISHKPICPGLLKTSRVRLDLPTSIIIWLVYLATEQKSLMLIHGLVCSHQTAMLH